MFKACWVTQDSSNLMICHPASSTCLTKQLTSVCRNNTLSLYSWMNAFKHPHMYIDVRRMYITNVLFTYASTQNFCEPNDRKDIKIYLASFNATEI